MICAHTDPKRAHKQSYLIEYYWGFIIFGTCEDAIILDNLKLSRFKPRAISALSCTFFLKMTNGEIAFFFDLSFFYGEWRFFFTCHLRKVPRSRCFLSVSYLELALVHPTGSTVSMSTHRTGCCLVQQMSMHADTLKLLLKLNLSSLKLISTGPQPLRLLLLPGQPAIFWSTKALPQAYVL